MIIWNIMFYIEWLRIFFFHLSVGNTVSLKLMGFFQKKITCSFMGKKKYRGCWFRKSAHSKTKLFHASNWLQYFISCCQAEMCVGSHKNDSTISSTHHSLHCSLSLDSLFCDSLLFCNSVLQRSYKLMLDYNHREKASRSL